MLTRRSLLAGAAATTLSACARPYSRDAAPAPVAPEPPPPPPMPAFYDAITTEPYPIPAIPPGSVDPVHWRQQVENPFPDKSYGTIVVDPDAGKLYFVEDSATATRYGVSVGAQGFSWQGTARLQFTRDWPVWKVPAETIARKPQYAEYSVAKGGMPPGPGNPMGARAMYLFQNGEDTLYRIHGSAIPRELGRAVSSGCIRMLDQDAIHLEARSVHGCDVIVLPSMRPPGPGALY